MTQCCPRRESGRTVAVLCGVLVDHHHLHRAGEYRGRHDPAGDPLHAGGKGTRRQ